MISAPNTKQNPGLKHKRCPDCFARLPLSAGVCPQCGQKVGRVNKYGLARKPFNWRGYTLCLLSVSAFGFYIWWAFFKT
jgi:predicted amidophosphoribosyltransferase